MGADSLHLALPRILLNAYCGLPQAESGRLSAHAHYPFAKACSLHHWSALREPAPMGRKHMGEAHRMLGVPISQSGIPNWGSMGKASQWLVGSPLHGVCDAISGICILFICLEPWLLVSQSLTAPKSCSSWLSTLDGVRKKWGERNGPLWQHPAQLGRPGTHYCSRYPPAPPPPPALGNSRQRRALLTLSCVASGEGWCR